MAKKFAVEAHYPFVFVPFNKNRVCLAARSQVMNHMGSGYKHNLPASLVKTHAPVQVFAVHEITIVQGADIQQRVAPYQHTGAGDSFDLNGAVRQRLLMQQEILSLRTANLTRYCLA